MPAEGAIGLAESQNFLERRHGGESFEASYPGPASAGRCVSEGLEPREANVIIPRDPDSKSLQTAKQSIDW